MDILIFIYILAFADGKFDTTSLLMVLIALTAFAFTWAINRISILRIRKSVSQNTEISDIMQRTLDISNNFVLRLDLREKRAYSLHGHLLPREGISFQEGLDYIHPDDHHIYRSFISHLASEGKTTDDCIVRWDMSGEKHLGEWRYMHGQGVVEYMDGGKYPINLYCTLTDQTVQIMQEEEEQELTDKYRQTFEQSIVGLAFYDNDGTLLTVNRKLREILNFISEDDPYYFGKTLYELPLFRDVFSGRHAQDLYFCTRCVIVERNVHCYTELRVHPITDENGELTYITISIRDVTQERELYLQNKRNILEIRRANEEIQRYENEIQYLMRSCDLRFWRTSFTDRTVIFYSGLNTEEKKMSFEELRNHLVKSRFKDELLNPEEFLKEPNTDLCLCHPFFHEGEALQWNIIDCVPYLDENGRQLGTYGIIRNVNPLIEKQEELRRETERANDSGRMKSVFMANMTHEIRTPLNSIVGFSDILPMLSTPEEKKEIVRIIMNNCDMLLRLINDILAISSLDAGGISIEPKEVDFAKSFDDICESLRQRVQEPRVEFIKENLFSTYETVLDDGRVQQVITNFVTNAVKYTHQGHIKVGFHEETRDGRDGLYIYCEDTGEGIPKESQGKIFDRFVKLNDYIQGTGLGLSICKAIADGCHGDVGVNSEGKDQGSTFWLWVPCEARRKEPREN